VPVTYADSYGDEGLQAGASRFRALAWNHRPDRSLSR